MPKFPTAKPTKSSIRQSKKIARSNSRELQKANQREKAFKRELRQAMENDRRVNEERYKRKAIDERIGRLFEEIRYKDLGKISALQVRQEPYVVVLFLYLYIW